MSSFVPVKTSLSLGSCGHLGEDAGGDSGMSLCWHLAPCPLSGMSVRAGPGSPSKDWGTGRGAVAVGTRAGEERLSLLCVCVCQDSLEEKMKQGIK